MASTCYIELRKSSARGSESTIADFMRHLHTRQHLGKAVIVHEQAPSIISPARKQWLKLARSLQKQRASTLNADKILKYTHGITRMQGMLFSSKTPLERPEGDIYFLKPEEMGLMPMECWSLYVLCPVDPRTAADAVQQLPQDALIVDYTRSSVWHELGLLPKKRLEIRVTKQWYKADQFLRTQRIDTTKFVVDGVYDIDSMDDALDNLLGGGHVNQFLQVAGDFQRILELARPLRLSKKQRALYDTLILLAHRVQALSKSAFGAQFLEVYDEDDSFFLYDPSHKLVNAPTENLKEAYARHKAAGRHHLARSLRAMTDL